MKKKLIAGLTLGVLLGSTGITAASAAQTFTDVSSTDRNETYINDLYSKGKIVGEGDGTFGVNNNITRAEFVTMVERAFSVPSVGSSASMPFKDSNGWYHQQVMDAYANHITDGISATEFGPDLTISRQECAQMIWNYLSRNNLTKPNANASQFDASDADSWAKDGVQNIMAYGFRTELVSNVKYNSKSLMTRGDAAALIDLSMQSLTNNTTNSTPQDYTQHAKTTAITKGDTITATSSNGGTRHDKVVDILNPTSSSSNLIYDPSTDTYKLGNLPMLSTDSTTPIWQSDIQEMNDGAKILSQLTFKLDMTSGDMTVTLPSTSGTDYVYKYPDLANNSWDMKIPSTSTITAKYMNMKGSVFVLYLDRDASKSTQIQFPVGVVNITNTNSGLAFSYANIDFN